MSLDLAAVALRAADATEGPWHLLPEAAPWERTLAIRSANNMLIGRVLLPMLYAGPGEPGRLLLTGWQAEADAVFLAAARTDVPALVAEVERLQAALAAADEARYLAGG